MFYKVKRIDKNKTYKSHRNISVFRHFYGFYFKKLSLTLQKQPAVKLLINFTAGCFFIVQEIIELLNARFKLYQGFYEYKTLEAAFPKRVWQSPF